MRKLAVLALILSVCGLVGLAADRIYTNPDPSAHLRRLFPKAVSFSSLEGTPLHFVAHSAESKANPSAPPLGYGFWTTDLVPNEVGYHGPIHILVGMDLTGILTGVVVDWDSEPYGYFSVEPEKFALQFKGKSVRDPFIVGRDVDAVSRASISIGSAARAIRDSSRMMARQFLNPDAVRR